MTDQVNPGGNGLIFKKMKKAFLPVAAALLALVSCQKENLFAVERVAEAKTILHASVAPASRVQMDAVGVFGWQTSDKIAVLDGSGAAHQFTATSAGSSSEFECVGKFALGAYASYPYSASFSADGNNVSFEIPASISYSADATNMPMLGKISGDAATFKAVGGMMKLVVYGVPGGATTLTFTAKKQKINGIFSIPDASVADPVISTAAKGVGDNSIVIDFSGKYNVNMVFYIPLPTGTIEGFDISFNDAAGTAKSVAADLVIGRNKCILAPTLVFPMVMWKETFTGYGANATFSSSAILTDGSHDAVAYGGASITYTTVNGGSTTKTYNETLAGGASPELLVSKSNGYFKAFNIPTLGESKLQISYKSNKNFLVLETNSSGVTFSGSYDGDSSTYTGVISNSKGLSSISIFIKNGNSSTNARIDDIQVSIGTPSPEITFTGAATQTIAEGATTAAGLTGVALTDAVDGTGIGVETSDPWLLANLSGSTLSISATGALYGTSTRTGYVHMRATGAPSQTITVVQNPQPEEGLPQYLGCYEIPAIDLYDSSMYTSTGEESFGSTSWYQYNTTNSKRRVITHTYEYSSSLYRNYTALVDQDKRCALWTAYPMHATAYPNNDVKRGSFCYDPALPRSWQSSGSTDDYDNGNGYARGHHCASEDRQACRDANDQTFYYTNQSPQWQNYFNGGMWASLEGAVQSNAPTGRDTLYVVVGTVFDPLNMHASNDGGNVARPSHYYKCLMKCTFNASGTMTAASGVAYLYSNEAHASGTYNDATYRKTIDYIETLTGFDFFANVPAALQDAAESTSASLW